MKPSVLPAFSLRLSHLVPGVIQSYPGFNARYHRRDRRDKQISCIHGKFRQHMPGSRAILVVPPTQQTIGHSKPRLILSQGWDKVGQVRQEPRLRAVFGCPGQVGYP